ncbi:MAG: hypothetical protein ACEQSR_16720 [Candidatus Methylacidiphilales bacterium]|jgi:hypothetical protein
MTYLSINTNKKEAKLFLEYIKTLSFVTIHQEPNEITKKAIEEVKQGKTKKHKSAKDLTAFLNK